jgi:hypothetical protein
MTASNKKMSSALPLLLTILILWEQLMKQGVLSTQLGSLTGSGQLRPRTEKQNCEFSDERKRIVNLDFWLFGLGLLTIRTLEFVGIQVLLSIVYYSIMLKFFQQPQHAVLRPLPMR